MRRVSQTPASRTVTSQARQVHRAATLLCAPWWNQQGQGVGGGGEEGVLNGKGGALLTAPPHRPGQRTVHVCRAQGS